MRIPPVFALCLLLSIAACEKRLPVGVDNPRPYAVQVQIDATTLQLEPYTFQTLELAPGRHEVITHRGDQLLVRGDFMVSQAGMVNATRSWYIRLRDIYFRPDVLKQAPAGKLDTLTIYIYGHPFTGDLKLFSDEDLFIPREWNQQPHEALPDPAQADIRRNPGYLLVSKLYRVEDFLKEYSEGLIPIDTAAYRAFFDSLHRTLPAN